MNPNTATVKRANGDIAAAFDFTYYANDNHSINFGAAGTYRTFQPGSYSTELMDTFDNIKPFKSVFRNTLTALEGSLYVEDEWKVGKRFSDSPGDLGLTGSQVAKQVTIP